MKPLFHAGLLFLVVGTVLAVILGGVHFSVGGRHNPLHLTMGVMFYLQVNEERAYRNS